MEEAEKLFYGGRYAEAIKLYDKVLSIEPDWDRARQHRTEAEGYLRTGYIPAVALPAEAATAFGKAQSAARLGRYPDALALLMRAQNILTQFGIQRWQEGNEFEQKLQQNIDAENVYNEGIQLFSQGQLDEGIDRVDTAATATGLPRYGERLAQIHARARPDPLQRRSAQRAHPRPQDRGPGQVGPGWAGLEIRPEPGAAKHERPARSRRSPGGRPIKDQIQALKPQAVRAQTLEAARASARQARQLVDQAHGLGYNDDDLDRLQGEIDKVLQDISRYDDQLEQAARCWTPTAPGPLTRRA